MSNLGINVFQVKGWVAIWPPDLAKPKKAKKTNISVMINIKPPPIVDKISIEREK